MSGNITAQISTLNIPKKIDSPLAFIVLKVTQTRIQDNANRLRHDQWI